MSPDERQALADLVAARARHFPKRVGPTRHLATCSRGDWQGNRDRWVRDEAGWGAPCTPNCLADTQAFDRVEQLLDREIRMAAAS